jgi:hypothetical protein
VSNDDLEARLAGWRPADPPPALLRRLRAAEPPARARRVSWARAPLAAARPSSGLVRQALAACAAVLIASVLILALRPTSPLSTSTAGAPAAAPAGDSPNAAFDLSTFGRPGLRYAVLDAGPNNNSGGAFRLDEPAGPLRLDYGCTLPNDNASTSPFGAFHLNVRDPF